MKTELEQTDFKAIARKVVEMLLPLIPSARPDDEVFDKQGLADYLKGRYLVDRQANHQQGHTILQSWEIYQVQEEPYRPVA